MNNFWGMLNYQQEEWLAFVSIVGVCVLSWFLVRRVIVRRRRRVEERINLARREAKLEAREEGSIREREFEANMMQAERDLQKMEYELERRDMEIKELLDTTRMREDTLAEREEVLAEHLEEGEKGVVALENLKQLYRLRLREVTGLDEGEVKACLLAEMREEMEDEIRLMRHEVLSQSFEDIESEAKRVLMDSMCRLSLDHTSSTTANMIRIPSEDVKGRLIGKEGRNIRAFEMACGVTMLIDETPGMVFVSSFDPVRREVGRRALEELIGDGRIHPTTIEEVIKKQAMEMVKDIKRVGQEVITRLKLRRVPGDVAELLGRLKYHHSNNQNTLEHSVEVGHLCGLIASELRLDVEVAKRSGLFHDIGKGIGCEEGWSHSCAAGDILRRNNEDARVINAVEASHGEVESESIYAEIVKVADKISATRPGARSEAIDGYIQRISQLEGIAKGFEGVEDAYAIQAGREVRVVVSPEIYSDPESLILAGKIREQVEAEVSYPGKVVVTVIRERRFVEVAC